MHHRNPVHNRDPLFWFSLRDSWKFVSAACGLLWCECCSSDIMLIFECSVRDLSIGLFSEYLLILTFQEISQGFLCAITIDSLSVSRDIGMTIVHQVLSELIIEKLLEKWISKISSWRESQLHSLQVTITPWCQRSSFSLVLVIFHCWCCWMSFPILCILFVPRSVRKKCPKYFYHLILVVKRYHIVYEISLRNRKSHSRLT